MPSYQLLVQLDSNQPAIAGLQRVRAFIDPETTASLSSEVELPINCKAGMWSATFVLAPGSDFFYRLGLEAEEGVRWMLSIRECSRGDREILFDSDFMALPKQWLVGACRVP